MEQAAHTTSKWLSDKQVAERYAIGRVTPWRWAREGIFPAPIKLGPSCTRWRLADLEAWEASREVAQ
ncbi:AlpA family phage regulatory protein [Halomonas desiderata]|uniref:helix-turn-helix transcriptional regulator n=1 Tax=Billgrantia desiderata TaxID=52021 RepID=UPI00174B93A0|nr:AlpA family phage regulatory protein [Halomonas desiderata]